MNQSPNQYVVDKLLDFDFSQNIHVDCIPKLVSKGKTSLYLSAEEKKDICVSLGDSAYVLMETYYDKTRSIKFDFFDDDKVAVLLGWTPRKVKQYRLALVNAGWIKKVTYIQPTTKAKSIIYYVGKEAASRIQTPSEFTEAQKLRNHIQPWLEQRGFKDMHMLKAHPDASNLIADLLQYIKETTNNDLSSL